MNKSLTKEEVLAIASEMGVDASFIEKDFYAVQIIERVAGFECLGAKPVFSGGTSLSKAYGLIQRFSEDLDFKINNGSSFTVGQRKTIRHAFRDLIAGIDGLEIINVATANGGKQETLDVKYPQLFSISERLRQNLQVELFFDEDAVETEERKINSFIAHYAGEKEGVKINCNKPINIAADKFNAITWRIYQEGETIDYTLMRHLHDLCAIVARIKDTTRFKEKVLNNFEKKDRARVKEDISFEDTIRVTLKKLANSKSYKNGYIRFVDSMSYAPDAERISFDEALECFRKLSELF